MLIIGLLSIVVYWICVAYILKRWNFDHTLTISDHVVSGGQRRLYNLIATLFVNVFMLYLVLFLLPRYSSSWLAYTAVFVAWIGELVVIQYPRADKYLNFHDNVATIVGAAVIALVALLGFSGHATTQTKQFTLISLLLLAIVGNQLLKETKKHYLFYQIAYFCGIHIVLLVLGFLNN